MELTIDEKIELEIAYRAENNAKVKIRYLSLVYMFIDGLTVDETSRLLRLGTTMVQKYRTTFQKEGLKGVRIIRCSTGSPSLLDEGQLNKLKQIVDQGSFVKSVEVCTWVYQEWEVAYTPNAMTKILKKLGFTYKKPKTVPGKADTKVQESFLNSTLEPLISKASEMNPVYFADAMHLKHNSQAVCGWILKGKEKKLKQNTGRLQININGLFGIHNHSMIYRTDDWINTDSNINLLKQVRSIHHKDVTIHIVLDNASYNKSEKLFEYTKNHNIELHFLPAYSPNLNLIERFWRFLRKHITYNKYYEKFSIFKEIVLSFLDNIHHFKEELSSLLVPKFHIIQEA